MSGQFGKLGKLAPRHDPRTLSLRRYFPGAAKLGIPMPAAFDLTAQVGAWPMLGNDRYACCTCSAAGHHEQLWSVLLHDPRLEVTPAEADVLALYFQSANGGVPFPPGAAQDAGADCLALLNLWRARGLCGIKPFSFVAIDPRDDEQVREGVCLFGGVYAGVELPVEAQAQSGPGMVWADTKGTAGSWGGHAIPLLSYTPAALGLPTWGFYQFASWDFWHRYGSEAFVILPDDWQGRPDGFDFAALQADLATITQVR